MHSVCDDFTIFKQLFPYDMTCCFQDVVIDVIDVNSGLSPMIYIRNQMVYPWNEEIISLAIFNFGKKKTKQKNKHVSSYIERRQRGRVSSVSDSQPRRSRVTRTGHSGRICSRLSPVQIAPFLIRMFFIFYFFRSRLNTLIFLPILGWKFLVFLLSYSLSLFRFRMYSSLPLIAWA